jgi:DNA polymerase-3 subunit epsilon
MRTKREQEKEAELATDSDNLDDLAAMLEQSQRFRVLRRLPDTPVLQAPIAGEPLFTGAVVDTETTGINPDVDSIIELAIARFVYGGTSGRIVALLDGFDGLQQPSRPLSKAVAKITGLSDDVLKGHHINAAAVAAQLADVNLCVAHQAQFDRPILERAFPTLPIRPWGCSMTEIDWAAQGAAGRRLSDLLALHGLFNAGHRASADAKALLHLLSLPLPATGELTLAALLAAARRASAIIIAAGAPFAASSRLKDRGYRWSPSQPKGWWRAIDADQLGAESAFLHAEIYPDSTQQPLAVLITAAERFRPLSRLVAKLAPASIVAKQKNSDDP